MPVGLEVTTEDGGGMWVLGHEGCDVVADTAIFGDGIWVAPCREIGADEKDGGSVWRADEERGCACPVE